MPARHAVAHGPRRLHAVSSAGARSDAEEKTPIMARPTDGEGFAATTTPSVAVARSEAR